MVSFYAYLFLLHSIIFDFGTTVVLLVVVTLVTGVSSHNRNLPQKFAFMIYHNQKSTISMEGAGGTGRARFSRKAGARAPVSATYEYEYAVPLSQMGCALLLKVKYPPCTREGRCSFEFHGLSSRDEKQNEKLVDYRDGELGQAVQNVLLKLFALSPNFWQFVLLS
jgi:hypothetical protein